MLHLVVGPSGVGKDSLIDAARDLRRDIFFPRRVITRPAGAGGEDHAPADVQAFALRAARGEFMLHWGAHGLSYGVPIEAAEALEMGRHVVVNLSRSRVAEARRRFPPIRVLAVTATAETLAARLAARGRESAEEIAGRLARADLGAPEGPDVVEISNDGALKDAQDRFLSALTPPQGRWKTMPPAPVRSPA
ncbi:MAG: phosphonate metabolism protein/1,5-bisphosphokinase (PRPP-forming) PhnN [Pseudomonadota bacterium]